MKNFNKAYNLKIISSIAAVTFLLNSAVYGIDISNPSQKSQGFSPRNECKLFSAREGALAFRPRGSTNTHLRVPVGQKNTLERMYKVMHEGKTEITQVNGKNRQIQQMLELSDKSLAQDWESVQSQWKIEKLRYFPEGIQKSGLKDSQSQEVTKDQFGNYPHWVYEVTNTQNGTKVYVGPNDVETLFPQRKPEIAQLRKDKESLLTGYKSKALNIYKLHSLFDINEIELSQLKDLLETDKIGDRHLDQIDSIYNHLESLWQSRFPDLALDRYINIMDDLTKLIKFLKSKDKHLSFISKEEENRLQQIISKIEKSSLSSSEDIVFIDALHEKLLNYQNQRIRESASWALGRPTAVNQDQEARAPAYGANLWIANWLNNRLKTNGKKPIILDVGANLSVFWRIFQQVSQDNAKSDGIIDLENNDNIYQDAPNPNGVLADISKPEESGLPLVRDAKNDVSSELLKTPNNCEIVITSFVLDQLEPEELRNSLISLENLLAKPPQEKLTQDNLDEFPLLIIASPEHAPLTESSFEKVLKEAGYTIIQSQYNLSNSLSEETRNRILKEEGKERLEEIEKAISKPFHVGVYAKTKPAEKGSIEKAKLSNFALKTGQSRKRTNGDEIASSQKNRIDVDMLYNLDIISSLRPSDFNVNSQNIVTRRAIVADPAYEDFENRLACLIYFKKHLNAKDTAMLESIVNLWDKQKVGFLSEEQVKFVMERPLSTKTRQALSYPDFAKSYPHLAKMPHRERVFKEFVKKERQRNYPLYEIYELENAYRKKISEERNITLPSVFKRTRTQHAIRKEIRIREIKQIVKEAPEGEANLTYVAERMTPKMTRKGLSIWLKDNNIDPSRLGIIKLHKEERIEQIKQIVKEAPKGKANLTYVAERLRPKMTMYGLSSWLKENNINPSSLEIIKVVKEKVYKEERIEQIKQIVKEAPKGKANLTYVAERMTPKRTTDALSGWLKYNNIDQASLGIVIGAHNRRPSTEGSPAKCLETLYDNDKFKNERFTIKDLIKERIKSQGGKFSRTTVDVELKELIKLGLVARTRVGKAYEYRLTVRARGFTAEQIAAICAIPELSHFKIGETSVVDEQINEILQREDINADEESVDTIKQGVSEEFLFLAKPINNIVDAMIKNRELIKILTGDRGKKLATPENLRILIFAIFNNSVLTENFLLNGLISIYNANKDSFTNENFEFVLNELKRNEENKSKAFDIIKHFVMKDRSFATKDIFDMSVDSFIKEENGEAGELIEVILEANSMYAKKPELDLIYNALEKEMSHNEGQRNHQFMVEALNVLSGFAKADSSLAIEPVFNTIFDILLEDYDDPDLHYDLLISSATQALITFLEAKPHDFANEAAFKTFLDFLESKKSKTFGGVEIAALGVFARANHIFATQDTFNLILQLFLQNLDNADEYFGRTEEKNRDYTNSAYRSSAIKASEAIEILVRQNKALANEDNLIRFLSEITVFAPDYVAIRSVPQFIKSDHKCATDKSLKAALKVLADYTGMNDFFGGLFNMTPNIVIKQCTYRIMGLFLIVNKGAFTKLNLDFAKEKNIHNDVLPYFMTADPDKFATQSKLDSLLEKLLEGGIHTIDNLQLLRVIIECINKLATQPNFNSIIKLIEHGLKKYKECVIKEDRNRSGLIALFYNKLLIDTVFSFIQINPDIIKDHSNGEIFLRFLEDDIEKGRDLENILLKILLLFAGKDNRYLDSVINYMEKNIEFLKLTRREQDIDQAKIDMVYLLALRDIVTYKHKLTLGSHQFIKLWIYQKIKEDPDMDLKKLAEKIKKDILPDLYIRESLQKDLPNMGCEIAKHKNDTAKNELVISNSSMDIYIPHAVRPSATQGNTIELRSLPSSLHIVFLNLLMHIKLGLLDDTSDYPITIEDALDQEAFFMIAMSIFDNKYIGPNLLNIIPTEQFSDIISYGNVYKGYIGQTVDTTEGGLHRDKTQTFFYDKTFQWIGLLYRYLEENNKKFIEIDPNTGFEREITKDELMLRVLKSDLERKAILSYYAFKALKNDEADSEEICLYNEVKSKIREYLFALKDENGDIFTSEDVRIILGYKDKNFYFPLGPKTPYKLNEEKARSVLIKMHNYFKSHPDVYREYVGLIEGSMDSLKEKYFKTHPLSKNMFDLMEFGLDGLSYANKNIFPEEEVLDSKLFETGIPSSELLETIYVLAEIGGEPSYKALKALLESSSGPKIKEASQNALMTIKERGFSISEASNNIEGSPAECLKTLYDKFRDERFTISGIIKDRINPKTGLPFSRDTISVELKELIKLGLVARTRVGNAYEYRLTDRARGFTAEQIASICAIPELNHFKIGNDSIVEVVNIKINEIAPGGKFTSTSKKGQTFNGVASSTNNENMKKGQRIKGPHGAGTIIDIKKNLQTGLLEAMVELDREGQVLKYVSKSIEKLESIQAPKTEEKISAKQLVELVDDSNTTESRLGIEGSIWKGFYMGAIRNLPLSEKLDKLVKKVFKKGREQGALTHGVQLKLGGIKNLAAIILEGAIKPGNIVEEGNKERTVSIGLLNGDFRGPYSDGNDAGDYGPYYVIFSSDTVSYIKKHLDDTGQYNWPGQIPYDRHGFYLVPTKEDQQYLYNVLDAALANGLIDKEYATIARKKIITYEQYINKDIKVEPDTIPGVGAMGAFQLVDEAIDSAEKALKRGNLSPEEISNLRDSLEEQKESLTNLIAINNEQLGREEAAIDPQTQLANEKMAHIDELIIKVTKLKEAKDIESGDRISGDSILKRITTDGAIIIQHSDVKDIKRTDLPDGGHIIIHITGHISVKKGQQMTTYDASLGPIEQVFDSEGNLKETLQKLPEEPAQKLPPTIIDTGGKFTSMGTRPNRLKNIDSLMSDIIDAEYPDKEASIIDFGVGYPPITPSELAVKLSGKAKVIGVDIIVPAYAVEISGKLLEKEGVAWPFDYVAFFDENGNFMHYHSFVMGGSGSGEVKRKALAERLLKDALSSGADLKEGEALEKEGCVVKYKPFKQYERENLSFEKGDFGFRSKEKVDMIRAFNVMRHYKMEKIQGAITSLGENLKDGGTLIVGEENEQGSTVQFIIYKKIKGEMVPVKFGVSIDTNTTSVGFNKKIGPLYTKYSSLMDRIDRYFSEHKENIEHRLMIEETTEEKAGLIRGSIVDTLNKIGIKATSSASGNVLIDIKSYDDFQDIHGNKNSGDTKEPTETFLRPWGSWGSHYFIENNYFGCTRTSI